jgi:hypothetical protein
MYGRLRVGLLIWLLVVVVLVVVRFRFLVVGTLLAVILLYLDLVCLAATFVAISSALVRAARAPASCRWWLLAPCLVLCGFWPYAFYRVDLGGHAGFLEVELLLVIGSAVTVVISLAIWWLALLDSERGGVGSEDTEDLVASSAWCTTLAPLLLALTWPPLFMVGMN